MNKLKNLLGFLFSSKVKGAVTILVLVLLVFFGFKTLSSKGNAPQYQTAQVEKATLVTSVSASGTISSGNSVDITTTASGVVSDVFVKNGEAVTAGQQLATIQLDQSSQAKMAAAWSSYLSAKTALDAAQAKLNSLQSAEFKANQKLINDGVSRGLKSDDPTYIQENADWLQAEADYKNQQAVISQAQAAVNSASLSLSQISSTITAPASGTITNLVLTPGLPISPQSSGTAQKLGTINMEQQGGLQAVVNLSEIDVPKVNPGQKATLTLDAFSDKTFTGHVLSVNTNGVINSGVTNYPVNISLDTALTSIYPNMTVSAKIITNIKNNVLLVPTQAISTDNDQSTVRVLKNGKVQVVNVETGDSDDTRTEIKSGLNEGDTIITGVTSTVSNGARSPFNPFGGGAVLRPGGVGGGGRGGGR